MGGTGARRRAIQSSPAHLRGVCGARTGHFWRPPKNACADPASEPRSRVHEIPDLAHVVLFLVNVVPSCRDVTAFLIHEPSFLGNGVSLHLNGVSFPVNMIFFHVNVIFFHVSGVSFLVNVIFFHVNKVSFLVHVIFFHVNEVSFLVNVISFLVNVIFSLVHAIFFLVHAIFSLVHVIFSLDGELYLRALDPRLCLRAAASES